MFELVISGIILLAIGYCATMFAMGRRDDVLHGDFVQDECETESVQPATAFTMPSPPPARPVPAEPQSSRDSLQALLTAIKQDLQDAAKI
jgi:hypothetical protein